MNTERLPKLIAYTILGALSAAGWVLTFIFIAALYGGNTAIWGVL